MKKEQRSGHARSFLG